MLLSFNWNNTVEVIYECSINPLEVDIPQTRKPYGWLASAEKDNSSRRTTF